MNVVFRIHSYFEHCSIKYKGETYSYDSLTKMLNVIKKEYLKEHKLKQKKNNIKIDEFNFKYEFKEFEKSNLSDEEIKEYFFSKQKSKAKSWISSLRRKRKAGKLTQSQVEKLNQLGMLWNPSNDEWEKNYVLFQSDTLTDVLKYIKDKEWSIGTVKLKKLKNLELWIKNQKIFFNNKQISEENLDRLKKINFSFNEFEQNQVFSLVGLIEIISRINFLRREYSYDGAQSFSRKYGVQQKAYVGAPVEVSEKLILLKEQSEYENDYLSTIQFDKEWEKEQKNKKENAKQIIAEKSIDYFKEYVDKIAKMGPLTWNQKNTYYVSDGKKVFNYGEKYLERYMKLGYILKNRFNFPKTTLKNIVYDEVVIEYDFDENFKIYVAKKMIEILDKFLLKSEILNNNKSFKPVSYLINTYKKQKNFDALKDLKEIINEHELLNLIYGEKINTTIIKLKP